MADILQYSEIILIDNNLLVKAINHVQAKEIQNNKHLIEYLKKYASIKNLKIITNNITNNLFQKIKQLMKKNKII